MSIKSKGYELTPWHTNQETAFTAVIVPQLSECKNQPQNGQQFQFIQIKPQSREKKRIHTIESIVRLKTQKQKLHNVQLYSSRKRQNQTVREVRSLNGNLINIINTFYQNGNVKNVGSYQVNPEYQRHKLNVKRNLKDCSKNQKGKVNFERINPTKVKVDLQILKRSLSCKVNPHVENLPKTKSHLSRMSQHRQYPILRSYSVHNIGINSVQQKSTKKIVANPSSQNKLKNTNQFTMTSSSFRANENIKAFDMRLKTNSYQNKNQRHIIDRLFDKFQ